MTITPVLEAVTITAAFELYLEELGIALLAEGSNRAFWITRLLDHIEGDYAFLIWDCESPKGVIVNVNPMRPEILKEK